MIKTASCFLYVSLTLLYAWYTGDNYELMYGVGQLTILMFVVAVCSFALSGKPNTVIEKLFLQYSMYVTFGRALYTVYCLFMSKPWIIHNTDVFAFIVAVTFLIFLFYVAYKYSTFK